MRKYLKIVLIIFGIVLLDSLQALIFDNNPIIGIETKCNKKTGILVTTYHCNGKNKSVITSFSSSCDYESICGSTDTVNEKKSDNFMNNIKVTINGKVWEAKLENNETTRAFLKYLPKEFNMSELNGNEKYIYMDITLPTNSYNPSYINAGDIMLFGDNCLVIFYKSFKTSYSYTKIGHIDNLEDLGNGNIIASFSNDF